MSKVPQDLIDEATKRGIVPGTICKSPSSRAAYRVPPIDNWEMSYNGHDVLTGKMPGGTNRHIYCDEDGWADVITPEPSQPEGLKEGDAVECGPAMRAAIIELAKELGICNGMDGGIHDSTAVGVWNCLGKGTVNICGNLDRLIKHTPEAFMAKMRVTAAQPKPIKIGDNEVKFNTGSIKVGCTTVDNATVRAIAEKLID